MTAFFFVLKSVAYYGNICDMAVKELSAEMLEELQEAVAAWLEMSIQRLKLNAENKKLNNTGESIQSIAGKMVAMDDGQIDVLIDFKNSARFADYRKNVQYSKLPPVDLITEWVLSKGIGKFKYIPGYKNSTKKLVDTVAARRIAWGVATRRYQKGYGRKKPWFAKLMYGPLIAQLIQKSIEVIGTSSTKIFDYNLDKEIG
ncbi:MAG: hypothetical protein ACRC3H_21650 [Lachnospiraceae bacterium]